MNHVLYSYHTCPLEEPGTGLAGGMNVFLRGLLSGLGRLGIETDVLTRGRGTAVEVTRPYRGVRIFHVPCGWEEPPTREGAYRSLPRFIGRAGEILGREHRKRPGAVSAHYWMSGIAALDTAVWDRPPGLVFMFHTVEGRKAGSGGGRPDVLSAARRDAEERLAREADRVVFLSDHDRAATEKVLPGASGKGVVIPPGVDDRFRRRRARRGGRREFGVPRDSFLFLLAARADPGKNVSTAVHAFLRLRGKGHRDAQLLIAGQEPPAGGVPGGVRFFGPVPHAGMPALLSASDAVLCPSEYESFGLVPLEAMAAGVPVIVPRHGYWGETILEEGGGVAYPPGGARKMADAMEEILRDGSARARMAREGRRIASRFTWETCTESWAELLSSAATPGNPRGTPRVPASPRRPSSARRGASCSRRMRP